MVKIILQSPAGDILIRKLEIYIFNFLETYSLIFNTSYNMLHTMIAKVAFKKKKKNRYTYSYFFFVTNSAKALRPCLQGSRVALLRRNGSKISRVYMQNLQ